MAGTALVNGAPNNTIGGLTSAAENLISGNAVEGIMISGPTASGNLIAGNLVGLDVNGLYSLGNSGDGVSISDAAQNTIGGTTPVPPIPSRATPARASSSAGQRPATT